MKVDPDGLFILLVLMAAIGFFFGWLFATFRKSSIALDMQTEIIRLRKLLQG